MYYLGRLTFNGVPQLRYFNRPVDQHIAITAATPIPLRLHQIYKEKKVKQQG
jgi:hypothetical protein